MITILMTSVLAALAAPQADHPGHYVAGTSKSDSRCDSPVQEILGIDGGFMIHLKARCLDHWSVGTDRHLPLGAGTSLPLRPRAIELLWRKGSNHAQ